ADASRCRGAQGGGGPAVRARSAIQASAAARRLLGRDHHGKRLDGEGTKASAPPEGGDEGGEPQGIQRGAEAGGKEVGVRLEGGRLAGVTGQDRVVEPVSEVPRDVLSLAGEPQGERRVAVI